VLSEDQVVDDDEGVDCDERHFCQCRWKWGEILRSNVRTADIRLTNLVFVFGVSIPKPVVSGGSAHPTTPQPVNRVVLPLTRNRSSDRMATAFTSLER
jgi:hypothetical protein